MQHLFLAQKLVTTLAMLIKNPTIFLIFMLQSCHMFFFLFFYGVRNSHVFSSFEIQIWKKQCREFEKIVKNIFEHAIKQIVKLKSIIFQIISFFQIVLENR